MVDLAPSLILKIVTFESLKDIDADIKIGSQRQSLTRQAVLVPVTQKHSQHESLIV